KADAAFLSQPAPTAPATAPSTGLLNVPGIEDGGDIDTNLDGLIDLVATMESNGATPTGIILDPQAWATLRKLKTTTGSNEGLLGAGVSDAQRVLLDLPFTVSAAMSANTGLVIDKSAVVSAVGSVLVAKSDEIYFASDSVGLRATFRFGFNIVKPERVGKFTVADSVSE